MNNYILITDKENNTVTTQKRTIFLWVLWRDQHKQSETTQWGTKTKNNKEKCQFKNLT